MIVFNMKLSASILVVGAALAAEQKTAKKPEVTLEWAHSYSELGVEKAALEDLEHWTPLRPPGQGVYEKADLDITAFEFLKSPKSFQNIQRTKVVNNPWAPIWTPDLSPEDLDRYKRMAKWSAASYCSQDSLLSWSCGPRCEGSTADTHVAVYFKSSITDTVGFIAVYTDTVSMEDQIIISFRGSVSFENWIQDLRFVKEPSPWPDKENPGARVHTGFLDSYSDIATTVRSSVMVLAKRYTDARIIVTGHSLGGAVATLCAADLKFHLGWSTKIELVTFHSPRVGNLGFASFMAHIFAMSKVDPTVGDYMMRRFTNRDDPLCHLPPSWLEFLHISQECWVDFENKTKACDPDIVEDPNCSNSVLLPDNVESHFYIWNVIFGVDCSN